MTDGMTAGMGIWMLLVVLTVVALLVLATLGSVWFYRRLRGRPDGTKAAGRDDEDAAMRRLRERFAAGEIDEQEYESRLSALTHWR